MSRHRRKKLGLSKKCHVTGKTKYRSEEEANKAKIWIWSRDPSADITDLHVYECEHCKFYHVGHLSYYQKYLENKEKQDELS